MRIFVAAELPEPLLLALADTQASLRAAVRGRYVAPSSLHVTLAFLGELSAHDVADVTAAVEDAATGIAPVTTSLGELGSFGPARKATLWQAVEGDGLVRLAAAVRASLDEAGLAFDTTPFRAHVTLMRAADLTRGRLPAPLVAEASVEALCVCRSHLRPDGAVYEVLERIPLGGATAPWAGASAGGAHGGMG